MTTTRSAVLTTDKLYRYLLVRRWGKGPAMAVVMLNPSTADAEVDDPTIRRVVSLAKRHDHGSVYVANLFGYRATDPADLHGRQGPRRHHRSPDDDQELCHVAQSGRRRPGGRRPGALRLCTSWAVDALADYCKASVDPMSRTRRCLRLAAS